MKIKMTAMTLQVLGQWLYVASAL